MSQHYRAKVNAKERGVEAIGKGYYFISQYEALIPLFIKSILY